MQRTVVWISCFMGIYALCGCQGQGNDAASEHDEAVCAPSGRWQAVEERVGGDCGPDRLPESMITIDVSELDMTEEDALWRLEVTRGDRRLESCSGVPSENQCRIEITCSSGNLGEDRASYALNINLTGEGDLSGSNILTLAPVEGDECQANFSLEGEFVSPPEIESASREPERS